MRYAVIAVAQAENTNKQTHACQYRTVHAGRNTSTGRMTTMRRSPAIALRFTSVMRISTFGQSALQSWCQGAQHQQRDEICGAGIEKKWHVTMRKLQDVPSDEREDRSTK